MGQPESQVKGHKVLRADAVRKFLYKIYIPIIVQRFVLV